MSETVALFVFEPAGLRPPFVAPTTNALAKSALSTFDF